MISYYLRHKKIKYILAEDGINHFLKVNKYFFYRHTFFKKLKVYLYRFLFPESYNLISGDGTSKYIKSIELNSFLPYSIPKKVKVLDKLKLFSELNLNQKEFILKAFNIDIEDLKPAISNRNIILLTQPLKDDLFVNSANEQLIIYKSILDSYDLHKVIIKAHPRDNFDYKTFFNDAYIIDKNFPVEIINFINIKLDNAITISSSSIELLIAIENKIILGDEYIRKTLSTNLK
jgi:hypothetical protein